MLTSPFCLVPFSTHRIAVSAYLISDASPTSLHQFIKTEVM